MCGTWSETPKTGFLTSRLTSAHDKTNLGSKISRLCFLFTGRSNHCGGIRNNIAEKQVCDDRESYISHTAINLYSHGVPDAVSQCTCNVYLQNGTNYVSVAYFTYTNDREHCGLQVKLGNGETFACRSQRLINVTRFSVIEFSRASNSLSNMCLKIRSGNVFLFFFFCFFCFFFVCFFFSFVNICVFVFRFIIELYQ